MSKERVAVYIDGFNLFYGMKANGWRRYYWLNLKNLAQNLLRPHQDLQFVRYFTARVYEDASDPDKNTRQTSYLETLETLADLSIHFGYFQPKEIQCFDCGKVWQTYEEKMSDVNISVALLTDAQDDYYDTAVIISADGDLVEPVRTVLNRYPEKRVVVAFPPKRRSFNLKEVASATVVIGQDKLRKSQLPGTVTRPDGFVLRRPSAWK